jgi:hypothetical protein
MLLFFGRKICQLLLSDLFSIKTFILQCWFKKISEVEVTDSEKDQRGFYIKKVIGDGNCSSLDCLPMKKTFLLLSILLFCVF